MDEIYCLVAKNSREVLVLGKLNSRGTEGWMEYEFEGRWYMIPLSMQKLAIERFNSAFGQENIIQMTWSDFQSFEDAEPDSAELDIYLLAGTADRDPPITKYLPELLNKTEVAKLKKLRRRRTLMQMGFTYDEDKNTWVKPECMDAGWTFNKTTGYWDEDDW